MSDLLGTAVLVDGAIVAWFEDFDDVAREWCTENYFGEWLAWRATPPEIVPLTDAEEREAKQAAANFAAAIEEPNTGAKAVSVASEIILSQIIVDPLITDD